MKWRVILCTGPVESHSRVDCVALTVLDLPVILGEYVVFHTETDMQQVLAASIRSLEIVPA